MKDFLTNHLRIISSDKANLLLPFFSKHLRHHLMLHPPSIVASLFAAFDQLGLNFQLDEILLPNLLQIVPPKHTLVASLP
ncbi:uncharacterized protein BX663DRAFT_312037 [Cokeromyces recurvatus]|uniref:uncharacterized protein n=1 Tax=Cokeromyces recurvatus TaxID=90255 RepID=UPI002220D0ED|nr:uncharacterized protein BX663DRAFT_312037 [Cokeromyces recurvatus]KAI7905133.1 hypothetical protein BX663DRAFT_312037 [Cokeromyces recurvatus]